MNTYGSGHWLLALIIWLVVFIIPTWRIVSKAGFAGAWSLISIVPLVNIVALWVFAFMRWPNEK